MTIKNKRRLILGLGNPLIGDEGAGCVVAAKLDKMNLPDDVEVLDGGTGGIKLLHMLEGRDEILIIDCADFGGRPGEIREFGSESIVGLEDHPLSLHHIDLKGVLDLGRKLGFKYEVKIVGIQPKEIAFKRELSEEVNKAVNEVVGMILKTHGLIDG